MKRATYEDLMEVPDAKIAEIIDGELIVSSFSGLAGALATSVLGAEVRRSFHREAGDQLGGWEFALTRWWLPDATG